ncbi:hypothetical protein FNF29_00580 [Cafeteria roenbergensis]|uniref:Helicase ATP-binding domain-containing protein n=2 Tax=Cafeteria roenbergensis TaxID=33653 RepID=A0A5A8CWT8_CAFRO|nr:hypothetical protein FNF29_00580 [Cafeteria roenbergensis]|eukprot:KAA0157228.1 hypothetical protein FNF29_00580 [Cafeteria roenbergensis]
MAGAGESALAGALAAIAGSRLPCVERSGSSDVDEFAAGRLSEWWAAHRASPSASVSMVRCAALLRPPSALTGLTEGFITSWRTPTADEPVSGRTVQHLVALSSLPLAWLQSAGGTQRETLSITGDSCRSVSLARAADVVRDAASCCAATWRRAAQDLLLANPSSPIALATVRSLAGALDLGSAAARTDEAASSRLRRLVDLARQVVGNAQQAASRWRQLRDDLTHFQAHAAQQLIAPVLKALGSSDAGLREVVGQAAGELIAAGALSFATSSKNPLAEILARADLARKHASAEDLGDSALQRARVVAASATSPQQLVGMPRAPQGQSARSAPPLAPSAALPPGLKLRRYQQAGVEWLLAMRDLGMGALLCDEMGLGKTVQALCLLAHEASRGAARAAGLPKGADAGAESTPPSLIVCPSSVVRHWVAEAAAHFPEAAAAPPLRVVEIVGRSAEARRALVLSQAATCPGAAFVTSFAMLRRDAGWLGDMQWRVVVFDEAHVLRNPDSVVFKCAQRLSAEFRLGLTGTPVHNSPLDLWALAAAVVSGLLGSRRDFSRRFHRPVAIAARASATPAEHASASRAMAQLHSAMSPFILRRTKRAVLRELPPKVIQDVPCQLSATQREAYDAFVAGDGRSLAAGDGCAAKPFALIAKLRAICNHPALATTGSSGSPDVAGDRRATSITASGKMLALHSILEQCGLGCGRGKSSSGKDAAVAAASAVAAPPKPPRRRSKRARSESPGSGDRGDARVAAGAESAPELEASPEWGALGIGAHRHRVLLFAQGPQTLDLVQRVVLARYFPGARFARIDGKVPPSSRAGIVADFNHPESTLDGVMLTTGTGGVGLSLTGADVVIFVDHDWNPQNDLQAMDRAHRIGQRRTVNVLRLIAQGTLEERIMGLQAFKRRLASELVGTSGPTGGELTSSLVGAFGPAPQ